MTKNVYSEQVFEGSANEYRFLRRPSTF